MELVFGIGGMVGVLLVVLVRHIYTKKNHQKRLDDALTHLFFQQHHFLHTTKEKLFAYEKAKDILLGTKATFFTKPIHTPQKKAYLETAQKDMTYLKNLIKP